MKKTTLTTSIVSLFLAGGLLAGPAKDIAAKHAHESAVEIEKYLKENPTAEDKAEAVELLLAAYDLTGNKKRSAALLQEKFDGLGSGAKVDPQMLFSTTRQLFDALVEAGDKEGAKKVIADAVKKSKGNRAGQQLAQAFKQMEGQLNLPGIGDTMEIKFKSIQGEEIDLAKMKGKVVLVDFWATWCGPCIKELPNVKAAYKEHKDNGFDIIGISLDKEKGKLDGFIEENDMPWAQYFDGKGWGNEISTGFGINSIPAVFLIGKDGKVVATTADLRGDKLEKTLAKHLGGGEEKAEGKTDAKTDAVTEEKEAAE